MLSGKMEIVVSYTHEKFLIHHILAGWLDLTLFSKEGKCKVIAGTLSLLAYQLLKADFTSF